MKRKPVICGILLLVVCMALCSIITRNIVMGKAEPTKDTFAGTYQLDNGGHRLLTIFYDGESGSKFLIYDEDDNILYEGKYRVEGKALSMTCDGDDSCFGTLVYSYGDYIYIENEKSAIEVNKISDTPVMP